MEIARNTSSVQAVLNITSDKVYRNHETGNNFQEDDDLGGADPYSASKACSDLISYAYRETLSKLGNQMTVGVVRAGNIIGGGDWGENRLIPDFYRARINKTPLEIRYPY